jgi:hypothetical protein
MFADDDTSSLDQSRLARWVNNLRYGSITVGIEDAKSKARILTDSFIPVRTPSALNQEKIKAAAPNQTNQ